MFMFWSKRTVLTRRLLKSKVREEHETECEAQEDSSRVYVAAASSAFHSVDEDNQPQVLSPKGTRNKSNESRSVSSRLHHGCCGGGDRLQDDDDEEPSRLTLCKELLKTLKENQLEMLLTAIESYGADLSSCVLVPRGRSDTQEPQQVHRRFHPRYHHCSHSHHHHSHHHHHHYHHHHHHHHYHHYYLRHLNHYYPHHRHSHHRHHCCCDHDEQPDQTSQSKSYVDESSISLAATTKVERCRVPIRGSSWDIPFIDPLLLCCQIWRWPDLTHSSELKTLPICHSVKDPVYVCCNPYHWSRLCKPESPPPPYCLIPNKLRPEDRVPSEGEYSLECTNTTATPLHESLLTNKKGESVQKEWCTLAYWELGGRVGRLYPVEPATVNVFDSLHDGDGLCLSTLAENHPSPSIVQKTRSKIGLGLMLSMEADGVWAYNRSESPIFVNSPTLDDPESRTLLVYRVPPGFCLNIFDRTKTLERPILSSTAMMTTDSATTTTATTSTSMTTTTTTTSNRLTNSGFVSGPVDTNSVRISFAKGWGPKYSRQEVTSCPCWLEVLLAPCR